MRLRRKRPEGERGAELEKGGDSSGWPPRSGLLLSQSACLRSGLLKRLISRLICDRVRRTYREALSTVKDLPFRSERLPCRLSYMPLMVDPGL